MTSGLENSACKEKTVQESPTGRISKVPLVVVAVLIAGTVLARIAGTMLARIARYKVGGNVVVRCRQHHLFTTLWIPGVKLTAIDLAVARIQRCPVGPHWTVVVPVRDRDLTDDERLAAANAPRRPPTMTTHPRRPMPAVLRVSTSPS